MKTVRSKARRYFAAALALALCLSLLPVSAAATTSGDWEWSSFVDSSSTTRLLVTKYKGTATDVTVPTTVTDSTGTSHNVDGIAGNAFTGTNVTSVTMPNSLGYLAENAFIGAAALKSVTISSKVTEIKANTFNHCAALESVDLGGNVTAIGYDAFDYCTNLKTVTGGDSVTSLGEGAFYCCTSLTGMPFSNVQTIGKMAFCLCTGLQSAALPASLTSIGVQAFAGDTSLGGTLTIPKNVISIGTSAFSGDTALTGLVIDGAAVDVGGGAFQSCSKLKSANLGANTKTLGASVFSQSGLESIVIPDSVTSLGDQAFDFCLELKNVTLSNKLPSIGEGTFLYCSNLNGITIPASVASIGHEAFLGCTSLPSISIPANVKTVGYSAFRNCTGLSSAAIAKGSVTAIAYCMFDGCSSLPSVTIPEGVQSIYGKAFQTCSALTSVNLPSTLTRVDAEAFDRCAYSGGGFAAHTVNFGGTADQWTALKQWNSTGKTGINWSKTEYNDSGNTGNDYLKSNVTLTTSLKPAYAGTLAATPTVASKSGGTVTLNAVTPPDGESVEYGYSVSAAAEQAAWQDGLSFADLPAGTYYFFARVKASDNHLAGGVSASSDAVTVNAKPSVSYGAMDPLVIGNSITALTPAAVVPAGLAENTPYTMTGALPEGLSFDRATGVISGTPSAYSAAGGSVTVTVTDKEGTVSDAVAVPFGPVAKAANTMTSVTQADVLYNGAASLVAPVATSNGNAPSFLYKAKGAADDTYTATAPTQAGAYTVKATSSGSAAVADAAVTTDFSITPVTLTGLTYTGVTVTKTYDGTTGAGMVAGTVGFTGKIGSDDVSITAAAGPYADRNAGTGKPVELTLSLSGAAAGNYCLESNTASFSSAAITAFTGVTDNTNTTQTVIRGDGSFAVPTFAGAGSESAAGTITYTYLGAEKTYDQIKTALAALNSGASASISYSFAGSGNYAGASKSGTITATIVDIAFTVGTEAASVNNAVTRAASPVYGMTWSQLVTVRSGSIAARVGTAPVRGTYRLDVSGTPNAGAQDFKVLFSGALGGVTYTDVTVCTGKIDIAPKTLSSAAVTVSGTCTYTGAAQTPAVTVRDGSRVLTSPADYTAVYADNLNAGTASVTVTGTGNYAGTVSRNFTINKKPLAGANVTVGGTYAYTGAAQTPAAADVTVRFGTGPALSGTDYAFAASSNTNAGSATVTVTGRGNYSGTASGTYAIAKKTVTITPDAKSKTYGAADPVLTYTAAGLIGSDKVAGTLKRAAGENVGTYPIGDLTGLSVSGNYRLALAPSPVSLAITPAAYTLTGIPTTLYIGSTLTADTIKNAVRNAGAVTITGVEVRKADGTAPADAAAAAAIATVGAANAVTAKSAGKVVVTYTIAAADLNQDGTDEYTASGSQTVTLTLSAMPSGSSAAAVPTVTVPASSDAGSVKVSAAVTGATAAIAPTDAQISAVASASRETGTVVIDLSALKVDTAVLPGKLVSAARKADNAEGLAVVLPAGKVELDKTALTAVAGQGDLKISVQTVPAASLTQAQKAVLGSQAGAVVAVDVTLLSGGAKITSFGGGTITVRVPYTLKPGEDASRLAVWFLKDDGTLERHAASYDAKTSSVAFTTTHLSRYFIAEFPFTDVADSSYCYTAAAWAVNNGITGGKTAETFAPSAACTRAQTVTFLWRAMGSPEPASAVCPFTDVSPDDYCYKAVLWAVENGITKGATDTAFHPGGIVTRAQAVTFQYRAAGSPASSALTPFGDVASGVYYAGAVAWAVSRQITEGTSAASFSPAQPCTRGQIVTFLYRQLGR